MAKEEVKQMAHEVYKRHISNGGFGSKFDFINGYMACANEHNQWHKVEDGFPPRRCNTHFSEKVLITDGERICISYYNYKTCYWSDNIFVTHWMKLPNKEE